MLSDLDYYLAQIAATAGNPPVEQARYVPDCWWWLYLYEHHRSPAQFAAADRRHPLRPHHDPAQPVRHPVRCAADRGGDPGRLLPGPDRAPVRSAVPARRVLGRTPPCPWGLASIWGGSEVRYTWKGICDCVQTAPDRSTTSCSGGRVRTARSCCSSGTTSSATTSDWGGYSEARDNLDDPDRIDLDIARTQSRMPGIPFTGLFGAGWDDVELAEPSDIVNSVAGLQRSRHRQHRHRVQRHRLLPGARGERGRDHLATLRGGWGNDWDMWPASLAERTSRARRALERIRTAEAAGGVGGAPRSRVSGRRCARSRARPVLGVEVLRARLGRRWRRAFPESDAGGQGAAGHRTSSRRWRRR